MKAALSPATSGRRVASKSPQQAQSLSPSRAYPLCCGDWRQLWLLELRVLLDTASLFPWAGGATYPVDLRRAGALPVPVAFLLWWRIVMVSLLGLHSLMLIVAHYYRIEQLGNECPLVVCAFPARVNPMCQCSHRREQHQHAYGLCCVCGRLYI